MERRTLARWLVVSALACFGFFLLMGVAHAQDGSTQVQGSQSSNRPTANTGTATGTNNTGFSGGASARGGNGASAQQLGSNSGTVSQSGTAQSGDPVAGAQITGVVGDNVTVQNQNTATRPDARSGDARLTNNANVTVGPSARTTGGTAQVGQVGDNSLDLSQAGDATSGDAVAGSQITGIVGDGTHTVQNQNDSTRALTRTGLARATNNADTRVGPFARTTGRTAQASQTGDNDETLSQSSTAHSGDSVAGGQITGVVGGSARIQNSNSSTRSDARTGDARATNNVAPLSVVGPFARSTNGNAQTSQTGDNTADISQRADATTGDAVAGSQVTGAVGDQGGFLTVQNQQASENDVSRSGSPRAQNNLFFQPVAAAALAQRTAMASQNGDNAVTVDQGLNAKSGDALAGAQVTGDVGHDDVTVQNQNTARNPNARSGNVSRATGNIAGVFAGTAALSRTRSASSSQIGDNTADVTQSLTAASGDAVAGGQVTGVVAGGSKVTIQNSNDATNPTAITGDVIGIFNAAFVNAGALAQRNGAGAGTAQASQTGDNALALDQSVNAGSGDAVAGGQVTGVVASDAADITIQNQNTSRNANARSGEVRNLGNFAFAASATIAVRQGAGNGTAQASQTGDNSLDVRQDVTTGSGDAVAGGQVTGAVGGDGSKITIQNSNDSTRSNARTGDVRNLGNFLIAFDGATAIRGGAGNGTAQAQQNGDNSATIDQSVNASSGDAVAGAQVTGAVAGDGSTVTVMNQNSSNRDTARSGDVRNLGNAALLNVGVTARRGGTGTGTAGAQQLGDNTAAVSQAVTASSGDAVAGSQVTGVVAGEGSKVTVSVQNTANRPNARTGDVVGVTNTLRADLGAQARSNGGNAHASQTGDNSLDFSQDVSAHSGDAVAGSQVTGTVTASTTTVQASNDDNRPTARSGVTRATNTANGNLSTSARAPNNRASAQQNGDSTFNGTQGLDTGSGDAVAGGQVNGNVGSSSTSASPATVGGTGGVFGVATTA